MDDLVDFELVEADDKELNWKLLNDGKVQQTNITGQDQTKEDVVLCGRLLEAIHGWKAGTPCTIAIFEWYVHTRAPKKRFKFAKIGITFTSSTTNARDNPAVTECAPQGAYSLVPTTREVTKKKSWQPSASASILGVANVGSAFVYDLDETINRAEYIEVDGMPILDGASKDPDRHNGVEWTLFENEGQQSGIPRYFRTAVALERPSGTSATGRFTGKVSIKATMAGEWDDAKRRARVLLGRIPHDDPVIFDPSTNKTARVGLDLHALGSIALEEETGFLLFKEFAKKPESEKAAKAKDGQAGTTATEAK
jgi:hypothetical protein